MTEQSGEVDPALRIGGGPAAPLPVRWRPPRWAVPPALAIGTFIGFGLPSRELHLDLFRIGVVGLFLAALFLFSAGYFVPGGASEFTRWAEALAHGTILSSSVAERDGGFPLLLLLSGYTITGSFIGITLIHAVFAVLMPV